jgi:hypothetical protein
LLLLLRIPLPFLSNGSSVASPADSAAISVTTIAICIGISRRASHHLSAALPVSSALLLLTFTSVITFEWQTSSAVVLVVASLLADKSGQSRLPPRLCLNPLKCMDSFGRPPLVVQKVLGSSRRVNSTSKTGCRRPFCNCYCCCQRNALFLFLHDFSRMYVSVSTDC